MLLNIYQSLHEVIIIFLLPIVLSQINKKKKKQKEKNEENKGWNRLLLVWYDEF